MIDRDAGPADEAAPEPSVEGERLRACVGAHLPAVWRLLRRSGVPAGESDDAAQKVFLVFARRLSDVLPGRELSFLLRTALRVASEARRSQRRRREVLGVPVEAQRSNAAGPEAQLLQREALEQLDAILMQMDEPLRVAFVLYELEQMTMAEIAEKLEVPLGTVASRLRRARERFELLANAAREE